MRWAHTRAILSFVWYEYMVVTTPSSISGRFLGKMKYVPSRGSSLTATKLHGDFEFTNVDKGLFAILENVPGNSVMQYC